MSGSVEEVPRCRSVQGGQGPVGTRDTRVPDEGRDTERGE